MANKIYKISFKNKNQPVEVSVSTPNWLEFCANLKIYGFTKNSTWISRNLTNSEYETMMSDVFPKKKKNPIEGTLDFSVNEELLENREKSDRIVKIVGDDEFVKEVTADEKSIYIQNLIWEYRTLIEQDLKNKTEIKQIKEIDSIFREGINDPHIFNIIGNTAHLGYYLNNGDFHYEQIEFNTDFNRDSKFSHEGLAEKILYENKEELDSKQKELQKKITLDILFGGERDLKQKGGIFCTSGFKVLSEDENSKLFETPLKNLVGSYTDKNGVEKIVMSEDLRIWINSIFIKMYGSESIKIQGGKPSFVFGFSDELDAENILKVQGGSVAVQINENYKKILERNCNDILDNLEEQISYGETASKEMNVQVDKTVYATKENYSVLCEAFGGKVKKYKGHKIIVR